MVGEESGRIVPGTEHRTFGSGIWAVPGEVKAGVYRNSTPQEDMETFILVARN